MWSSNNFPHTDKATWMNSEMFQPNKSSYHVTGSNFTLLGNLEVLLAAKHHSLQHLMGRHVGLEVSRIPKFAHQFTKPLH